MVGASGFEPPASWSRTDRVNPITLYCGVAYGTRSVISPLLVIPNLHLDRFRVESRLGETIADYEPLAMILIIPSLVAALIARYPFVVAAGSPS